MYGAKVTAMSRDYVSQLVAPYTGFNGARGVVDYLKYNHNQIASISSVSPLVRLISDIDSYLLRLRTQDRLPDACGSLALLAYNVRTKRLIGGSIGDISCNAIIDGEHVRLTYPNAPQSVDNITMRIRNAADNRTTNNSVLFQHDHNMHSSDYLVGSRSRYSTNAIQIIDMVPDDYNTAFYLLSDGAYSVFPTRGQSLAAYLTSWAHGDHSQLDYVPFQTRYDDTTILKIHLGSVINSDGIWVYYADCGSYNMPIDVATFLGRFQYQRARPNPIQQLKKLIRR